MSTPCVLAGRTRIVCTSGPPVYSKGCFVARRLVRLACFHPSTTSTTVATVFSPCAICTLPCPHISCTWQPIGLPVSFRAADDPSKTGQPRLRHPADINKPLRVAAKEKVNKYQHTYANNHSISFLPAIFSITGRTDAEFLRLLFYHAHRESEEFFRLTGQLAQPNQDSVFSKRAAFFNGLKSKVGHIMAKATALKVNLNLARSIPSTPRPPARSSNAQLIYVLNLSHHVLRLLPAPHGT